MADRQYMGADGVWLDVDDNENEYMGARGTWVSEEATAGVGGGGVIEPLLGNGHLMGGGILIGGRLAA